MNNLDTTLNSLKEKLDDSEIIQEYKELKSIVENDEELIKMRENIARLASEGKNEEHDALLAIYNSHPIVVNYQQAREEVISLLKQIKDILSD